MTEFFESIQATAVLLAIACVVFGGYAVRLVRGLKTGQTPLWPLMMILLSGLVLRLGWCLYTQPEPLSDFKAYWDYAVAFRQGDFTFDTIIRHPGPGVLFYFATLLFGPNLWAAWILNLLLSGVLILLVYDLARYATGPRGGLLAAAIAAVLPQFITYNALTASEIMAVAFSLMFLWGFIKAWQAGDQRLLTWVALAFLLYGTLMIRISNILYLGLIPLALTLLDRPRLMAWVRPYMVLAGTTAVLLFSWAYHQYLVTGGHGFKLFYGAELGFACAVESRDGAYKNPSDWSFYPKVAPYFEGDGIPSLIKAYEATGVEARRIIMADPGAYLFNGFYRMKRVLNTAQTGVRWTEKGSDTLRAVKGKLVKRLATVSNVSWQILLYGCPLVLLALRGSPGREARMILTLLILYFCTWYVFHLVMALSNERYGFQVMPYVLVLFVAGVHALWGLIRKGPRPRSSVASDEPAPLPATTPEA